MSASHVAKLESKFRRAQELHQQGKRQQAKKLYRSVLKARPDHCDALHYLGLLTHQDGDSETAIGLLQSAIQRDPEYCEAIINLGNVYQEAERFSEAADCYRQAIAIRPDESATHSNLCVSLRRQDHLEEAIAAGRKAVTLDPENPIGWYNLGNAYKVAREYKQAIGCYRNAIKLKPDLSLAHDGLCQSTFQTERRTLVGRLSFRKTQKAYQQWLKFEPGNALAQFMLKAIGGDQQITRAPDEVVRGMFDQFAPNFETHLEKLDYRLPQLLPTYLLELLGPPRASLTLMDGGCGTGLCAPALKPWARRLIGVDISSAMLDQARSKELYDGLFEAELTQFLANSDTFDVLVFADALCYFGDLHQIFTASERALGSPGAMLFTLEASHSQAGARGFELHPTGRYTHTRAYVEEALIACGFSHIVIRSGSTRTEIGKAVEGLIVSARKGAE